MAGRNLTFFHYDPTYHDDSDDEGALATAASPPTPRAPPPAATERRGGEAQHALQAREANAAAVEEEEEVEVRSSACAAHATDAVALRSSALHFLSRRRRVGDPREEQRRCADDAEELAVVSVSAPQGSSETGVDEHNDCITDHSRHAAEGRGSGDVPRAGRPAAQRRSLADWVAAPRGATVTAMATEAARSQDAGDGEDLVAAVEVTPRRATRTPSISASAARFLADTDSSCRHKRCFDAEANACVWFCGCPHHIDGGGGAAAGEMAPTSTSPQPPADYGVLGAAATPPRRPQLCMGARHPFRPQLTPVSAALDAAALERRIDALCGSDSPSLTNRTQLEDGALAACDGSSDQRDDCGSSGHSQYTTHRHHGLARWDLLFQESAQREQRLMAAQTQRAMEVLAAERRAAMIGTGGAKKERRIVPIRRFHELHAGRGRDASNDNCGVGGGGGGGGNHRRTGKLSIAANADPGGAPAIAASTARAAAAGAPTLRTASRAATTSASRDAALTPRPSQVTGRPALSPGTRRMLREPRPAERAARAALHDPLLVGPDAVQQPL